MGLFRRILYANVEKSEFKDEKNAKKSTILRKRHFLIKWLPGSCGKKVYPLKSVEFDQESDGNVFKTS